MFILRETTFDFLNKNRVYAKQYLQMTGKHVPEKVNRPLFHLTFLNRIHCTSKCVIHAIPSILPVHIMLIY